MLSLNEPSVLPVAKKYLQKGVLEDECRSAIVRFEKRKSKEMVLERVREHSDTQLAGLYFKVTGDDSVAREILIQAEKNGKITPYQVYDQVAAIQDFGCSGVFDRLETYLANQVYIKNIRHQFAYRSLKVEQVAADIFKMGLSEKPVSNNAISQFKEKGYDYPPSNAWDLLDICDLLFYWSSYFHKGEEADYDNLFDTFRQNSKGKLRDLLCWTDVKEDTSRNLVFYTIYLVSGNKAYQLRLKPFDNRFEYDLDSALKMINRVLKDTGIQERFHVTAESDGFFTIVFAEKAKLDRFAAKYWPDY